MFERRDTIINSAYWGINPSLKPAFIFLIGSLADQGVFSTFFQNQNALFLLENNNFFELSLYLWILFNHFIVDFDSGWSWKRQSHSLKYSTVTWCCQWRIIQVRLRFLFISAVIFFPWVLVSIWILFRFCLIWIHHFNTNFFCFLKYILTFMTTCSLILFLNFYFCLWWLILNILNFFKIKYWDMRCFTSFAKSTWIQELFSRIFTDLFMNFQTMVIFIIWIRLWILVAIRNHNLGHLFDIFKRIFALVQLKILLNSSFIRILLIFGLFL